MKLCVQCQSGCVKCLESTIMSCSVKNRPEVLCKQAKVALDSLEFERFLSHNWQVLSKDKTGEGNKSSKSKSLWYSKTKYIYFSEESSFEMSFCHTL